MKWGFVTNDFTYGWLLLGKYITELFAPIPLNEKPF